MLRALFSLLLLGCPSPTDPAPCEGERLFGAPTEATGLSDAQCGPSCTCDGAPWTPPTYTADDLARWRALTLTSPPPIPTEDPYAAAPPDPPAPDAVCAVHREGSSYRLADYPSTTLAREAGASPTHFGRCGLCSTLHDLAVYAQTPDLTEPVRACGLTWIAGPAEDHVACLTDLGFTEPCAWIWYYNTRNTRRACAAPCFASLDAPYHEPDGRLNACLQCDEDHSGAVFQAIAGRTRRNTGLASNMCRPCSEVRWLEHDDRED